MSHTVVSKIFYLLLCICARASASTDQKNITAESGQNVHLTCRASNIKNDLVEWSRDDLGDEYVLFYRDGKFVPDNQHPSFKNRVDLQDRQMKDGDVSLILKDVTINDAGTYKCRVFTSGPNRRKRTDHSVEPISIIHLSVDPPGQTGGHTEDGGKEDGVSRGRLGLIAIPSIFVVMVVVVFFVKLRPA